MIEDEAVGVIAALSQLRESDSEKIKVPADGALWNLREDLLASQNDAYKSIGKCFRLNTEKFVISLYFLTGRHVNTTFY